MTTPMHAGKTRILILCSGFAGLYTAMRLERILSRRERERVEIALVNRDNYLVFQPFLPEVISGAIDTLHAICPIRRLVRFTRLHTRDVERIDLERKTVWLSPGF